MPKKTVSAKSDFSSFIEPFVNGFVNFFKALFHFLEGLLNGLGSFFRGISYLLVSVSILLLIVVLTVFLLFSSLGIKDSPVFQLYRNGLVKKVFVENELIKSYDGIDLTDFNFEELELMDGDILEKAVVENSDE